MFMHPILFGIGLTAAAIPLLVHWMTRPRPVRMPLSTIRLVSDALHQRRARHRLRDFLVLLLRCLAVALLAVAIARPLLVDDQRPPTGEQADQVTIVLLDASQSMAAIDGAATRFDSARAAAVNELHYKPKMAANLLIASHSAGAVFDMPSANLRLLRDRLGEASVTASGLNAARALEEVTRQFSQSPPDAIRELVVISDFQRSSWARADFSTLPTDTKVRLISMATEATPGNLAIEQARLSAMPSAGKPVTLLVDVANHSGDTRTVKCQLDLNSLSRTVEGTIKPQSRFTVQMTVDWPAAGWQWGSVRLIDTADALPADDTLPIAIGVSPGTRVAIVTEAERGAANGAFFVRQALSPSASANDDFEQDDSRLVTVTPGTLDTPTAQSAQLWIVTDVEAWDESVARRVAAWLRRGRAVLYIVRGPADANNLQALQQALGSDMQPPVELVATLDSENRRDLRVDELDRMNAPFNAFGDSLATTAATWRIGGGSPTRALGGAVLDAVAATLSDRSALLFFTDVGAGRLAVMNADLSVSNLAYQAGFVPLMVETIGRLIDTGGALNNTPSGRPVVRELSDGAVNPDQLKIVRASDPSNEDHSAGRIQSQQGRLVWNWPLATIPDVYRVADNNDRTIWAEAVRTDPAEQDLRSLSQEVLQQRLSGGRDIRYQTSLQAPSESDSLWVWATLAMLGCMIAEITTLFWFKS